MADAVATETLQMRPCAKCGTIPVPGADTCATCAGFLPANQAARKSGVHARVSPEMRQRAEALRAGIVADLGGETELSTLERSYVHKLGDLEILCRLLADDLVRHGLMTPSGASVRSAFDAYNTALATYDRYAQRLGMKRRGRRVANVADYIQQRPQPHVEEETPC